MNLSQLFSWSYLIEKSPSGDFLWGFAFLIFFISIIFISSFFQNPAKKDKYLKKSIRKKLWKFPILGIIGVILVLARFSSLPVLSMRIILLIITLITVFLLVFTLYQIKKEYSKRIKSAEREKLKRSS